MSTSIPGKESIKDKGMAIAKFVSDVAEFAPMTIGTVAFGYMSAPSKMAMLREGASVMAKTEAKLAGANLSAAVVKEIAKKEASKAMKNMAVRNARLGTALMASMSGVEKYEELEGNENMSDLAVVLDVVGNMAFEYLGERISDIEFGRYLKNLVENNGVAKAVEESSGVIEKMYRKALSAFGLASNIPIEGGSEMFTTIAQNAVSKYTGENPDIDIFDGAVDSLIEGGLMGVGFAGAGKVVEKMATPQQQAEDEASRVRRGVEDITHRDTGTVNIVTLANDNEGSEGQKPKWAVTEVNGDEAVIVPVLEGGLDPDRSRKIVKLTELDTDENGEITVLTKNSEDMVNDILNRNAQVAREATNVAAEMTASSQLGVNVGDNITVNGGNYIIEGIGSEGVTVSPIDENGEVAGPQQIMDIDQIAEAVNPTVQENAQPTENAPQQPQQQQREIPLMRDKEGAVMKDEDGNPLYDWEAMPPDQYADEYGKAFGKEKASSHIEKVVAKTQEAIEKLNQDIENSADPNEQLRLKRKADALKARMDGFNEVLKGLNPQTNENAIPQENAQETPQGEVVGGAETTESAEPIQQTTETAPTIEEEEEAPTQEELEGWQRTTMDTLAKEQAFARDRSKANDRLTESWDAMIDAAWKARQATRGRRKAQEEYEHAKAQHAIAVRNEMEVIARKYGDYIYRVIEDKSGAERAAKALGAEEMALNDIRNAVEANENIGGFSVGLGLVVVADSINGVDELERLYIHETQHSENKPFGEYTDIVGGIADAAKDMKELYDSIWVISGSNYYRDRYGLDTPSNRLLLADELIAHAMPLMLTGKATASDITKNKKIQKLLNEAYEDRRQNAFNNGRAEEQSGMAGRVPEGSEWNRDVRQDAMGENGENQTISEGTPERDGMGSRDGGEVGEDDIRFSVTENVNAKFNEQLQQQIEGTLPKGHIYRLGMPSAILRAANIPNLPIELSADRLKNKSEQKNHRFDIANIRNLPQAIQQPIAVFDSKTQANSNVILTELKDNKGNNFVAIMRVRKGDDSIKTEVNDVRSIYPKDRVGGIVDWVNSGLLRYVDKKKFADFITQSTNLAGGNKTDKSNEQMLNSLAKIIRDFENPQLNEENISQQDAEYLQAVESGDMEKAQEMVDEAAKEAGYTIKGYHGTTHLFNIFARNKGNAEGNWGKGFYFTNNEDDAEENYSSSEGTDLNNKIELLADQLEWQDGYEDMDYEQRKEEARKILDGGENRIISAALHMENPLVIGTHADMPETYFYYEEPYNEETEEYEGEPTVLLVDFYDAWNEVINKPEWEHNNIDPYPILEEAFGDGYTASQLESKAREVAAYIESDDGQMAVGEFLRQVFEHMGFDGIVDSNVNFKFGTQRKVGQSMNGMGDGTIHYIVNESNQAKQTDPVTYDDQGKVIPLSERFNPNKDDIRFSVTDNSLRAEVESKGQQFADDQRELLNEVFKDLGIDINLGDEVRFSIVSPSTVTERRDRNKDREAFKKAFKTGGEMAYDILYEKQGGTLATYPMELLEFLKDKIGVSEDLVAIVEKNHDWIIDRFRKENKKLFSGEETVETKAPDVAELLAKNGYTFLEHTMNNGMAIGVKCMYRDRFEKEGKTDKSHTPDDTYHSRSVICYFNDPSSRLRNQYVFTIEHHNAVNTPTAYELVANPELMTPEWEAYLEKEGRKREDGHLRILSKSVSHSQKRIERYSIF